MNIGFTIGKFAPLHKGHQYLIETALKEMDEFYIVVYDTDVTKVPTQNRMNWLKKLYPKANIIKAENPPMQYGLDEESIKIQIDYLKKIIGDIKVTHFYSSEEYGKYVAKYFNVVDERVDNKREKYSIAGSQIRKDIEGLKQYLPKMVYEDIIKEYKIEAKD